MPPMLTQVDDYQTPAVERLPTQLRGKPRIEALVRGLMESAETLEAGLFSLYEKRLLDSATGAMLDVYGRVVGEERRGLADEPFRLRIRAAVATSRSNGTGNELIRIFGLMTDFPVEIREEFPASFTLRVTDGPLLYPEVYADVLQRAKAGGVRALFGWLNSTPAQSFSFADGPGLGFYVAEPFAELGERENYNYDLGTDAEGPTLEIVGPLVSVGSAIRVRVFGAGSADDGLNYTYSLDDGFTWLGGLDSTDTANGGHLLTNNGDFDGTQVGLRLTFDAGDSGDYVGGEEYRWPVVLVPAGGGVLASLAHKLK